MPLTSLATVPDLAVRLGIDVDEPRAHALLVDVSARVRSYTGRDFTQATTSAEVDICCGKATLPVGPVISITSVKVDGVDVAYTWTSGTTIKIPGYSCATVVYVSGYAAVPADIVAVVCQIAGRAYGSNAADAGAPPESLGSYSIGAMGAAGAAGPLGMMNDERDTLDHYKGRSGKPIRQESWVW